MYHYVKRQLRGAARGIPVLCIAWAGVAHAQPVAAPNTQAVISRPPQRQIIFPAHLDISLYMPFAQAVQQSALWQVPLPENSRQIVRLSQFSMQQFRPVYRSALALSPREMQLEMMLTHEIWRGDQLLWTEQQARQQRWQFPGPRALSVGQSPTHYLAQMPQGAFAPLSPPPEMSPFAPAVFTQLTHHLAQDYLRWKQQQEQTL